MDIKYGSHNIDLKNLIDNLENNVSAYLDSHPEWSNQLKELFKNQYLLVKTGLQDSLDNKTDRFSIDEFGTMTDKLGVFKNGTNEENLFDKKGNLVSDTSLLSDKKKAKLTAFKAPQQVEGYINTILKGIVKKKDSTPKNIPTFADYWQTENDPNHELTDPNFWSKLDAEGKYDNRIKSTLESLDSYSNKYKLSEELTSNINKLKEILQSSDAGSDTWKRNLLTQAAKMGLANWTNGYFNLYGPETTLKKEVTPGSDDYFKLLIESYKDSTDKDLLSLYNQYMAYPNLREQIIKRLKDLYNQTELDILDNWKASDEDAAWNKWLTENPWYTRARLRKDLVYYTTPTQNNNTKVSNLAPESRAAFAAMVDAFNKADRKGDFLSTRINKSFSTTSGQTINIRNVGEALFYFQNLLNRYVDENGNRLNGWSSFDTFKDADGVTIYRLKNSEDAKGRPLYMFFNNGKLYSYRTYPLKAMRQIVLKGQLGLKVYNNNDITKARERNNQLQLNNPNIPEDTKRLIRANRKPSETGFTAAELARIASAITDIASLISSFVPVYGTAVSAGTGLASTAMNTFADISDDSLSAGDVIKNLGMNLGMDVVGLVPGFGSVSKAGKITKNLVKIVPKVMTILAAKNALSEDSRKSFSKILSDEKLTVHDWQNISAGLSALAGVGRGVAGHAKSSYMKNQAKTGEKYIMGKNGKQYKVTEEQLANIKSKKTLDELNAALKAIHADAELDKAFLDGTWNKLRHWQFSNPRTGNVYDYNRLLDNLDTKLWKAAQESSMHGLLFSGPRKFMDKFYRNLAYFDSLKSALEDAMIDNLMTTAKQEAATNLAAGSAYLDLLKKYRYNAKYARANSAPGNEDNYLLFKDLTDDLLRQLRGMSPEYRRLRGMVSNGKITFDNNGNLVVRNWSDIVSKYGLKYKKGGIIKALLGTLMPWYNGLLEVDKNTEFTSELDTENLYSGDLSNGLKDALVSDLAGLGTGSYLPTPTYTKELMAKIQDLDYYKNFRNKILDTNGNLTEIGIKWAKAVDKLLPKNSLATIFDENGNIRKSWTTNTNNIYGEKPSTFTRVGDYIDRLRNDLIAGGFHNLFINKGKRYFYKNNEGKRIYVNPQDLKKYKVSDKGEDSFENNTLWTDYELTGLAPESSKVDVEDSSYVPLQKKSIKDILNNISPTLLYGVPRALLALRTNRNNTDLLKRSALLTEPLAIHRNTYSDLNAEVNGYNNWALLRRMSATPYTSDASLNAAMRLEANNKGAALYLQGLQQSSAVARQSAEAAWNQEKENKQNAWQVANANKESQYNTDYYNKKIKAALNTLNYLAIDTLALEFLKEALTNWQLRKARADKFADRDITNYVKTQMTNPKFYASKGLSEDAVNLWSDVVSGLRPSSSLTPEEKSQFVNASRVADDLLNESLRNYFNIPQNRYYIPYTAEFHSNIKSAKSGSKLDIEYLRASAKDADRFYKTTKDFADRTERAIERLFNSKKKKKRT